MLHEINYNPTTIIHSQIKRINRERYLRTEFTDEFKFPESHFTSAY